MTDTAIPTSDVLERDIRQTQDDIGATVQQLEAKLAPGEVVRSVIGKDGTDLIGDAIEIVRRNPIPVALIAIGAIWLLAKSGATGAALFGRVTAIANADPAGSPAAAI